MEIDVVAYGVHLPPRVHRVSLDGPDHVAVIVQLRLALPVLPVLLVLLGRQGVLMGAGLGLYRPDYRKIRILRLRGQYGNLVTLGGILRIGGGDLGVRHVAVLVVWLVLNDPFPVDISLLAGSRQSGTFLVPSQRARHVLRVRDLGDVDGDMPVRRHAGGNGYPDTLHARVLAVIQVNHVRAPVPVPFLETGDHDTAIRIDMSHPGIHVTFQTVAERGDPPVGAGYRVGPVPEQLAEQPRRGETSPRIRALMGLDGLHPGARGIVGTIVPVEHLEPGPGVILPGPEIVALALGGVIIDHIDTHRHHLDARPDDPGPLDIRAVPVRDGPVPNLPAGLRVALVLAGGLPGSRLAPSELGEPYLLVRGHTVPEGADLG